MILNTIIHDNANFILVIMKLTVQLKYLTPVSFFRVSIPAHIPTTISVLLYHSPQQCRT